MLSNSGRENELPPVATIYLPFKFYVRKNPAQTRRKLCLVYIIRMMRGGKVKYPIHDEDRIGMLRIQNDELIQQVNRKLRFYR